MKLTPVNRTGIGERPRGEFTVAMELTRLQISTAPPLRLYTIIEINTTRMPREVEVDVLYLSLQM